MKISSLVWREIKTNTLSIKTQLQIDSFCRPAASCLIKTCTELYGGSGKREHKSWGNQASLVLPLISRLSAMWEHANGKVYCIRSQSNLLHGICPHTGLRKVFSSPSLLTTCVHQRVSAIFTSLSAYRYWIFWFLFICTCKTLYAKYIFILFLLLKESDCPLWESKQVKTF